MFDRLYKAAVDLNHDSLKILLNHSCVDIHQGIDTPASLLIKDGHFTAALCLINNYGANPHYPLREAAAQGNKDLVITLIQQGGSLNDAAEGAAKGNQVDLMEKLIALGASKDYAARGAAMNSNTTLLTSLLQRGASKDFAIVGAGIANQQQLIKTLVNAGVSKDYAARGAILGNHLDLTWELIAQGAQPNFALQDAAMSGLSKLVNELLTKSAQKKYAIMGAAIGGQIVFMQKLTPTDADYPHIVKGAALGGHTKSVKDLIKFRPDQLNAAIAAAASRGHIKLVFELLAYPHTSLLLALKSAIDHEQLLLINYLLNHCSKKINEQEILAQPKFNQATVVKLIAFIDNAKFRQFLVKQVFLEKKDCNQQLKKATKFNTLIRHYHYDWNQVEALTKLGQSERIWLLQGWQAWNNKISFEIFIAITMALLNLPLNQTLALRKLVTQKLYKDSIAAVQLSKKWLIWQSPSTCKNKIDAITTNYLRRGFPLEEETECSLNAITSTTSSHLLAK